MIIAPLSASRRSLRILGIRGIPAAHGGFETFAEQLALYLRQRDWRVTVYCQEDGDGPPFADDWHGIHRIRIPVSRPGPVGTMVFDWKCIRHAARFDDPCLTLGYNTAAFCARLRMRGIVNVMNMDGIEWRRSKWSRPAKAWFWLNDWLGCLIADHLIADNPEICRHLNTRVGLHKIATIPYGADRIASIDPRPLEPLGLTPGNYLTLIARPEPENSVLELVRAFSARRRGVRLAVLGNYDPAHPYQCRVLDAASSEVEFVGAIYDKPTLHALRFHCLAYLHGHQVGGTNPSLVEALGAGNPVVVNDNPFNRWVAGDAARYFDDFRSAEEIITRVIADEGLRQRMRAASEARFDEAFSWHGVLTQYEQLLERQVGARRRRPSPVVGGTPSDAEVER
ncbi:MAG TPA: DUF1972 domain-containing protein [Burkholderiaceae bacterium]|nr:DUF1972 domain-containing protein [Burkholderiaceae bacterium]